MAFDRITVDPAVMAGAPCTRGIRVPVATVVAMVGDGMTPEEILDDLPYIERADIDEALRFAAARRAEMTDTPLSTVDSSWLMRT